MHTYTWLIIWGSAETRTVSEPSPPHLPSATREAGVGAALAERSKQDKYTALNHCHNFTLDCRLKWVIGEAKSFSNLQQRLFVAVQQGNAAAVMGKMGSPPPLLISFFDSLSFLGWGTECLPFNWLPVFHCVHYHTSFKITPKTS